jgi:hypothetical protein
MLSPAPDSASTFRTEPANLLFQPVSLADPLLADCTSRRHLSGRLREKEAP